MTVVTASSSHGPVTRGHKKERTRRLLIGAAVEVIADKGETFTFSDISAQAGVASGTIYNCFSTRDELIDAVVPQVLGAFGAESAAAFLETDPVARLRDHHGPRATSRRGGSRGDERPAPTGQSASALRGEQRCVGSPAGRPRSRRDTGRFHGTIDDATVDVVIGALFAARRIIDGPVSDGYRARVVAQLLRSLGLQQAPAEALAAEAVAAADTIRPPDDNR